MRWSYRYRVRAEWESYERGVIRSRPCGRTNGCRSWRAGRGGDLARAVWPWVGISPPPRAARPTSGWKHPVEVRHRWLRVLVDGLNDAQLGTVQPDGAIDEHGAVHRVWTVAGHRGRRTRSGNRSPSLHCQQITEPAPDGPDLPEGRAAAGSPRPRRHGLTLPPPSLNVAARRDGHDLDVWGGAAFASRQ